ncbi:class I SAM-dependent methyltransferase [Rubellicoccus peritrichatus]|uniref:Class I SAM-dependent methyltransferase n=1 Tax=Rubellicoccus peritrichatus TaxID=3080537 RepID=A0AAQ3L954_9BACT|nr:class I SAM-dependent methyltransferase [Puniceicoccus sp. CR14]WOO41126.1 class I SAM-dependent methyltransferase [Puniceicoccus sp. CR14]
MNHPQDHFSSIATAYKDGRITYPEELYGYLAGLCEERECVWDCATGSGQAANDLSKYFAKVIATDISDSLLSHAKNKENIEFRAAPAEDSGITACSVDLITVAQAIHWFEFDAYWGEVERVLKPNGILAYWGYVWPVVDDRIDSLLEQFRENIASYWPEKSQHLQSGYVDVVAPLKRIENPDFSITESWSSAQYLKHLSSWSGTRYHREASMTDPVSDIEEELSLLWGSEIRPVQWPLILKVYQKAE